MEKNILKYKSIYNIIPVSIYKDLYVLEASYRKRQPDVSKKKMSKPYYALHLFLDGSGTLIVPNKTYTIKTGDIWVRFPGEPIQYFDCKETPWSYIFIAFQGTLAMPTLTRLSLSPDNRIFESTDKLNSLFISCILDCKNNPYFKDLIANAYLNDIFAQLAITRQEPASKKYSAPNEYIESALKYIDINLSSTTLDAHEVADFLNLNKDYFLRIFKNELHVPFSKYIITKRLNQAVFLMESAKESSIANIAEAVGYSDVAYFSYSFKKTYALSPREYIKTLSKKSLFLNK